MIPLIGMCQKTEYMLTQNLYRNSHSRSIIITSKNNSNIQQPNKKTKCVSLKGILFNHKKNEVLLCAPTWTNLGNTIVRETTNKKSFMWNYLLYNFMYVKFLRVKYAETESGFMTVCRWESQWFTNGCGHSF